MQQFAPMSITWRNVCPCVPEDMYKKSYSNNVSNIKKKNSSLMRECICKLWQINTMESNGAMKINK